MGKENISILLIEGDKGGVSFFKSLLVTTVFRDATVKTASTITKGCEALNKQVFDLVYLGINGSADCEPETLRSLSETYQETSVMILLGEECTDEVVQELKSLGFEHLKKNKLESGALEMSLRYGLQRNKQATDSKQREQNLLEASIEIQERERSRIATDLHDGLGQTLASMNMHLNAILPDILDQLDDSKVLFVTRLLKLSKRATHETRLISHNLMPSSIQKFGICRAISELVQNMNELDQSLNIQLTCSLEKARYAPEIELSTYRIVQEIISNTIKHARAEWLKLSLSEEDGNLILTAQDNGRGIKMNNSDQTGIGMQGMYNRIKAMDGQICVNSVVRKGTGINIKIPALRQEAQEKNFDKHSAVA